MQRCMWWCYHSQFDAISTATRHSQTAQLAIPIMESSLLKPDEALIES